MNGKNEEKLKKIATYLRKTGITSNDEDDLLAEYEDTLSFEEIKEVCNFLAAMEREEEQ